MTRWVVGSWIRGCQRLERSALPQWHTVSYFKQSKLMTVQSVLVKQAHRTEPTEAKVKKHSGASSSQVSRDRFIDCQQCIFGDACDETVLTNVIFFRVAEILPPNKEARQIRQHLAHILLQLKLVSMKSLTASYIASTSINGGNLQQRVHTLIPCSAIPRRGRHAVRHVTSASFHEAGYLLADAVSKVADKADQTAAKVGSVDAPGWVLPVA